MLRRDIIWTSPQSLSFAKLYRNNPTVARDIIIWCATRFVVASITVILLWQCFMVEYGNISAWRKKSWWSMKNPTGEPIHGGNNIMLMETSCLFGESNTTVMSIRQTCSIEAAAKMNPDAQVYLLHSCPIHFSPEESITKLREYSNINFWKMSLENLVSGTVVQDWDYKGVLNGSKWSIKHLKDMVRFILLWKYGGLCMDLDFAVIKSLSILDQNFLVADTDSVLHNNILKLQQDDLGHKFAETCIQKLFPVSPDNDVSYNGQQRLTECLQEFCQIKKLSEIDPDKCKISVYLSHHFVPIKLEERKMLFDESKTEYVDNKILNTLTVYLWNENNNDEKVYHVSQQPYNVLAKNYCPLVHSISGKSF